MKAVILAGGRGERLRPITDTRPKPLVPVLARPVMDYCLSLLAHHGTTHAFVTTHYLASQIRHRYGSSAFGMEISYACEDTPLGTAGGVKALEKSLAGEEYFVVMSGDALCDFDLKKAVSFHLEKKADVTIVLSSVKTPLEYGVVLSDTFERIFAFSEKPDWSEAFSDQVNTGVYILSPKILSQIPEGREFDFSRDLFPLLLKQGYSLFGYKDSGYWCDIGHLPTLYRCNMDLLQGKIKTYLEPVGKRKIGADGKGYCFVSDGAVVEEGAVVRSGSILSPGAHLASGARVDASLVLEKVKLEKGAEARQSVLCEETILRENAIALPGSVLGAGTTVMPSGTAGSAKKYPPYSVISPRPAFREESLSFTEKGILWGKENGLDRSRVPALGTAFARAFQKDVLVFWDEKEAESAVFSALIAAGVVQGGKNAVLAGEGSTEVASYAASLLCLPAVFVTAEGSRARIFGFEEDGLPLVRKDTLRLSRHFALPSGKETGRLLMHPALGEKYIHALAETIGENAPMSLALSGSGASYFRKAAILSGFRAYNHTRKEGISFEMFPSRIKFFLGRDKIADTENLRLYVISRQLASGKKDFVLPDSCPAYFTDYIKEKGGKSQRFSMDQTCREEREKRRLAQKERWLYDLNFLAAKVLFLIKGRPEEEIREEFAALPRLYISQLEYHPAEENKAKLIGLYHLQDNKEKKARIHPGFHGIRIISEALSFEAALENVMECRGNLNEIEKTIRGS